MLRKIAKSAALVVGLVMAGLIAVCAPAVAAQPSLVGGTGATGDTGWMASLQYDAPDYGVYGHHTCGGALVFRGWVASAAHCVTDPPSGVARKTAVNRFVTDSLDIPTAAKQFYVRVDSKDRTVGGQRVKVVQIVAHPGWKWGQGAPTDEVDDQSMLKLEHNVDVQPIQLAARGARPGEKLRLYGWGMDDPSGADPDLPRRLQQLDVKALSPAKCVDIFISAKETCVSNPNGTDGPAPGDSGGPAVAFPNGVPQLEGAASRSASEYPGVTPTVYTSTPDFRTFIYDTARGVPAQGAASPLSYMS